MASSPSKLMLVSPTTPEERRESEVEARRRFIEARRACGCTQLEWAMKLSVSRGSVEDYEAGKTDMKAWVLIRAEKLAAGVRRAA
jgi:DNA-binding XRE family transcriptional regulator